MASRPRPLPADFGARLRAARAYANDISREDFAEQLGLSGASASNLRVYERGERAPSPLVAEALIPRIAEATGIEESFLWGDQTAAPIEDRLAAIEDQVRLARAELAAHDEEAMQRIATALVATLEAQRRQRS